MRQILKRILQLVNLVAAIALLLAYLSVHISPEKIWPLAFFGLAYPYLLLVNLIFLIFWIVQRKRTFLLSMFIILLGFNHVKNFIHIPLSKNKALNDAHPVNIMTYNVRLFNHYNWSEKKMMHKKIMQFANDQQNDVLCLQEFFVNEKDYPTEEDILDQSPQLNYKHIHYHNMSPNKKFGIATLSKYPIIYKGILEFKGSLNLTIYTDIKIGTDTVRVYNCHLRSFHLKYNDISFIEEIKLEYSEKQFNEARALSRKLRSAFIDRAQQVDFVAQHIHNSPYPVIVCGDFNDTPTSYAYKTMRGKLKDAFTESGLGSSNTYTAKALSYRIDYILHNKMFDTQKYKRHKIDYSDHYPVTARILIPKTADAPDQGSPRKE